jgi:hypothetical protein
VERPEPDARSGVVDLGGEFAPEDERGDQDSCHHPRPGKTRTVAKVAPRALGGGPTEEEVPDREIPERKCDDGDQEEQERLTEPLHLGEADSAASRTMPVTHRR